MVKIGFVLLHYNNVDVTNEAIHYIKKLDSQMMDVDIVIVDNNSPNGSGKLLEKIYANDNSIRIILNNQNLGFAKGNNIGYLWLKKHDRYSFIIVMNTDVFIKDEYFLKKLLLIENKYEIIGPDIITINGTHQNPLRLHTMTNHEIDVLYHYNNIMYKIYRLPALGYLTMLIMEAKNKKVKKNVVYCEKDLEDVVLHGACVIFTDKWICKEEVAFLPKTFMYVEEDILAEYMKTKGYHSLFTRDLSVCHIEDASLNESYKSRLKKRQFLAQNMALSAKVLRKLRSENEKIRI